MLFRAYCNFPFRSLCYIKLFCIPEVRAYNRIVVICKAVIKQLFGAVKAILCGLARHYHRHKLEPVAFGGCRNAVFRGRCGAGFKPGGALIKSYKLIRVHKLAFAVTQAIHPNGGVVLYKRVLYKRRGHNRNIIGRGQMPLGIKPRAVLKMGVGHSKLRRPLVHKRHKALLTARNRLGKRGAGIIGGRYYRSLKQIVHGHGFPGLKPYLRPAHRGGVLACGNHRFKG